MSPRAPRASVALKKERVIKIVVASICLNSCGSVSVSNWHRPEPMTDSLV